MIFNSTNYEDEAIELNNQAIKFRSYRNISYVKKPAEPNLQVLNIFIPYDYINNKEINGYTKNTAPIFLPNGIGGYRESKPCSPCITEEGCPNVVARALQRGYVVISAGSRGKNTICSDKYVGKAPACIIDQKAAVRFIRSISSQICGDTDKIISNGTSAGGAVSALLGATGDAQEYIPYLEELGAENNSDRVFASSCYCPITNLEHADMAYEWQYGFLKQRHYNNRSSGKAVPCVEKLSEQQLELSSKLSKQFMPYLNSIKPNGLELNKCYEGSFMEFINNNLLKSARLASEQGIEILLQAGISPDFDSIDFRKYCEYITRMKSPGCFDSINCNTWENELFGTEKENYRHFTEFATAEDRDNHLKASSDIIRLMNPMNFISNEGCAKHWRIRHGAADRDTSFAISAILALCLQEMGYNVDYALPWGIPHSGNYDLDDLFLWIDNICKVL